MRERKNKFSTQEKVRILLGGMRYAGGLPGFVDERARHGVPTVTGKGRFKGGEEGPISRRNGAPDPKEQSGSGELVT